MELTSAVPQNIINELVDKARTAPEGCFVEIGVYKGGTGYQLAKLAEEQNRQIFLYDTFEGIPYTSDMDYHKVGDFNDTDYETVKNAIPYATVVKGLFPESAIEMPPIAFLHLDCDQYKSVIDSVNYLLPKMVSGGIIWFDDAAPGQNVQKGNVNGAHWAMLELFDGKYQVCKNSNKVFVVV
jgi:hypothetical protein